MTQTLLTPSQSSSANPISSSGGLWALGGYFYQFVGGLCRAIRTFHRKEEELSKKGWKVVFSMEDFDQDAVEQILAYDDEVASVEIKERRFIQFKYSRDPQKYPIQPDELLEIVTALKESRNEANKISSAVTKFVVITNRPLSKKTLKAIEAAANWKKSNSVLHPVPVLDDQIDVKHNNGTLSQKRKWAQADIEVLNQIQWKEEAMREQIIAIEKRALSLGVLPAEVEDRVLALVGHYFSEVSKKALFVKREQLDARLSGLEEGRCLTEEEARREMHKDFERFLSETGAQGNTAPRSFEAQLREAMKYRALIFLYGDGGNGKTTLLCRLMADSAILPRNAMTRATFGFVYCASNWTHRALSQDVGRWRGDKKNKDTEEDWLRTMNRLHAAAEVDEVNLPVVFHLGLDAVDEVEDTIFSSEVESLIHYFWKRDQALKTGQHPDAVLLVSCRTHPKHIIRPNNPYQHLEELPNQSFFEVPEFSPRELAQVAGLSETQGETIKILIERMKRKGGIANPGVTDLDAPSERAMLSAQQTFEDEDDLDGDDWDEMLIESLFHPTVWHCFEKLSSDEQQAALHHDAEARQKLGKHLVGWFLRKAGARRRRYRGDISRDGELMLGCAAQSLQSHGQTTGDYMAHWMEPARSIGLNPELVKIFYDEALSSGLIMAPAQGRWRWKHSFMQNALLGDKS